MAITLGARQGASAFAVGNGFKNVRGAGSRLVLTPERLDTNAHGLVVIALGARPRARAFARERARALRARREPPRRLVLV